MTRIKTIRNGALIGLMCSVAACLVVGYLPLGSGASRWVDDVRKANFAPPSQQNDKIIILTITESTLAGFPYRSPIQRSFLAQMLANLDEAKPAVIGVDILLDQPTLEHDDLLLKNTLHDMETPVVLVSGDLSTGMTGAQIEFQLQFLQGLNTGLANLSKQDGVVRYNFPGKLVGGEYQPGFAFAVAERVGIKLNSSPQQIPYAANIQDDLTPFRRFPAESSAFLPAEWLKDNIVLIGADLPQQDRHRTPLSQKAGHPELLTPGVEIHAHSIAQLVSGTEIPLLSKTQERVLVFIAALLGVILSLLSMPLAATIALAFLFLAAGWFVSFTLFTAGGPLIELLAPSFGFLMALGVSGGYGRRKERALKRMLKNAFQRYLSPKVIDQMLVDPSKLVLGGETREMSFIFTDIAGFTSLSERLSSEQIVGLLQDYLAGIVDIALNHEGTIDKFIGDAVVIFFGAPAEQPDHATRAIRCALEIDRHAEQFRLEQVAAGIGFGETRIGVHSGKATVGNIGSEERFEYTSIGDTVNTAARLESVNKHFGTRVCISGDALEKSNVDALRPIGLVVLKGKERSIDLFSSYTEQSDSPVAQYLDAYHAMEEGESSALAQFKLLANRYPQDVLVRYHLARLTSGDAGLDIKMENK